MNSYVKLSELTEKIRLSLIENFNEYYFITAEILQINLNASGHCYLELIEKEEQTGLIAAKIKAIIWSSKFKSISSSFLEITGEKLSNGMKILAKVEVNFHSVFGISLVIQDIDATYTLGEYEVMRQKVIDRLTKDGVMNMNKELDFPIVPNRFAIISSLSAAGLGDFLDHLESNPQNYKFSYKVFDSVMQGDDTDKSIINALSQIFKILNNFDFVVIIRGGGSKHDLSAFDGYDLCSHISQFPLPVLTGIGHQRDTSVADLVAYKSLKTPTAVADFIIQKTFDFDVFVSEKIEIISHIAKELISENILLFNHKKMLIHNLSSNLLNNCKNYIVSEKRMFQFKIKSIIDNNKSSIYLTKKSYQFAVKKVIQNQISFINNQKIFFKNSLLNHLKNVYSSLKERHQKIEMLNPQKIQKMGYSIVLKDNIPIRTVSELKTGDKITIVLQDGKIKSTIN